MAEECNLVTTQVSASLVPPSVSIAMPGITRKSFYIIVDVRSLHHLRQIQRHPIKRHPCLRVSVDVFVTGPRNSRCTGQ